jgi:hypothetical protein
MQYNVTDNINVAIFSVHQRLLKIGSENEILFSKAPVLVSANKFTFTAAERTFNKTGNVRVT